MFLHVCTSTLTTLSDGTVIFSIIGTGYMCSRICTLIKSKVVLQSEKENRNWTAYRKHTLEDAIMRAERAALKYLNSAAGDLWLTLTSYAKAEEIMNERLANETAESRLKRIEKRKLKIIRTYEKRIAKVVEQRDKKLSRLDKALEQLKAELAVARAGYMTQRLEVKIEAVVAEMNELPEHATIRKLHDSCELACLRAEEVLLNDYEDLSEDEGELSKPMKTSIKKREADDSIMNEVFNEYKKLIESANDKINLRIEAYKATERSMRVAMDIASIRVRKLWLISHGEFAEVQREMKHELFTQYVSNSVATVRRKTEDGFKNIETVREALKGRDIRRLFDEWRSWVKEKKRRARRCSSTLKICNIRFILFFCLGTCGMNICKLCVDLMPRWRAWLLLQNTLKTGSSWRTYLPEGLFGRIAKLGKSPWRNLASSIIYRLHFEFPRPRRDCLQMLLFRRLQTTKTRKYTEEQPVVPNSYRAMRSANLGASSSRMPSMLATPKERISRTYQTEVVESTLSRAKSIPR